MNPRGEAFVYIASWGAERHKIGISGRPKVRRATLQHGVGASVKLLYSRASENAVQIERIAHSLVANKHMEGEWFLISYEEAVAVVNRAFRMFSGGKIEAGKLQRSAIAAAIPYVAGTYPQRMAYLARVVGLLREGECQHDFVRSAIEAEIGRRANEACK